MTTTEETSAMFPDLTADEVLAATAARWDTAGPLPVPHPGWLACPVCRYHVLQPRHWRFHIRDEATIRGRCDVSFKCCACAAVWYHGVALDKHTWARMSGGRNRQIGWRAARQILTDHGFTGIGTVQTSGTVGATNPT